MTLLLKGIIVIMAVLTFAQAVLFLKAKDGKESKRDTQYTYAIIAITSLMLLGSLFVAGKTGYAQRNQIKSGLKTQLMI